MKTQKKDQSSKSGGNGRTNGELESLLHRHPFFNGVRSITPIWPHPYQGSQQSFSQVAGGISPISSGYIGTQPFINPYFQSIPVNQFGHTQPIYAHTQQFGGAQPFINPYFQTIPVSQFAHTQPIYGHTQQFGAGAQGSGFFPPVQQFQQSLINAEIIPAANISEDEESFFIQLTVPGYKSDECKIKVKDRTLFIKGQRETENDKDGTFYSVKEYRNSFFERFFQLSDEVETDQIEANCVDGILTVTLPKKSSESLKEKEIEVGEEFLV